MKKIKWLLFFLMMIFTTPVMAANYELRELIPAGTQTTIVTRHFSYKSFYLHTEEVEGETFESSFIIFTGIKNLTDEELPVSITIALFGKDKKNIGTIRYCSSNDTTSALQGTMLGARQEISYSIPVNKFFLMDGKTAKDVSYIAVLDDNINCNQAGALDYIGESVEEIGTIKNHQIDSQSMIFFKFLAVVGGGLLLLLLYRIFFTNRYQNMNGDDLRKSFQTHQEELKEEKEEELRAHPPTPEVVVPNKSPEIIQQEEAAKENEASELRNLYK